MTPEGATLKACLAYDPETGNITNTVKRMGVHVGKQRPRRIPAGYMLFRFANKWMYAHRLAYLLMTGEWPPRGLEIDHINGDQSDNRWVNLRLATRSQNTANSVHPRRNTYGRGVLYDSRKKKRPYSAMIKFEGKRRYLGAFCTAEEASAAYQSARRELYGEFAPQNA